MLKKDRRRHFHLINKQLQYGILALVLFYGSLFVVCLALILFVPDIVQVGNHGLSLDVGAAAADRFLAERLWVWPAVLAFIGLIAFHSFRFLRRVVGPLYRFRVIFKQVLNGDLSYPVKIRAKDYLHPEAETLNDMLRVLTEKLEHIQQANADTMKTLEELEKNIPDEFVASNAYKVLVAAHRRNLEVMVAPGASGSGFQPGISGKETSW